MSDNLQADSKRVGFFTKEYFRYMNESIYVGARLIRNRRALTSLGFIVALGGLAMTIVNILQHKGFVTFTTTAITLIGLFMVFALEALVYGS